MHPKENALRIMRFDNPERVVGGPPMAGVCYHGCNHEGYAGGGHDCPVGTIWTDIWGTVWHKELEGVMAFPCGYPLEGPEQMADYSWPNPDDERICATIYQMAEGINRDEVFVCGGHRNTLWEKAYKLVGMENMMMYLYTEPDFAREVLRRIMDFQLGIARHYLAVGIDFAGLGDDLGMQDRPLLNPEIVEEFFMPEYRRLCDLYKKNGVHIAFHSCGQVEWMAENFITLGVDILNPVQASANDLDNLRALTQGKMSLQGGVSSHTVMTGPPERIAEEVKHRLRQLGKEGGYFCTPDQGMPFPEENLQAFNNALHQYGTYPLTREHGGLADGELVEPPSPRKRAYKQSTVWRPASGRTRLHDERNLE